jgi:hypothetical protein
MSKVISGYDPSLIYTLFPMDMLGMAMEYYRVTPKSMERLIKIPSKGCSK